MQISTTPKGGLGAERATPKMKLHIRPWSAIEQRQIQWLWKPYIQQGALNLLTGDPGIGKSTIVCEIAGALSEGRPLPGEERRPPMNVWLMNGEDNAEDTIVWRLSNQGGDKNRIFITDNSIAIDSGIAREIEARVMELKIGLVVIDPLQSWMGEGINMNQANETRAWGGLLRNIAQRTNCAFLFVRHRRKGAPGDISLQSGLGSIDISGFARSEIGVSKDQEKGICYIHRTKGNVGRTGEGLKYSIETHPDPENMHGVLRWGGPHIVQIGRKTINTVPKDQARALLWLQKTLAKGPMQSAALLEGAKEAKISLTTLNRVKKMAAESTIDGGLWYWRLKDGTIDAIDSATVPEHSIVGGQGAG